MSAPTQPPVTVEDVRRAVDQLQAWLDDDTASPTILGGILVRLLPAHTARVGAEAVAEERQQCADEIRAVAVSKPGLVAGGMEHAAALITLGSTARDIETQRGYIAAGSVPVATPAELGAQLPCVDPATEHERRNAAAVLESVVAEWRQACHAERAWAMSLTAEVARLTGALAVSEAERVEVFTEAASYRAAIEGAISGVLHTIDFETERPKTLVTIETLDEIGWSQQPYWIIPAAALGDGAQQPRNRQAGWMGPPDEFAQTGDGA